MFRTYRFKSFFKIPYQNWIAWASVTPLVTNQCLHPPIHLLQAFMGSTLKLLQCMEFFSLRTLVIGVKLLKEFDDRVKSEHALIVKLLPLPSGIEGHTPTL